MIRQPIVTVAGHVDHGKTSLLDAIRHTSIAEKEPGAITQKISFSILPKENIEAECKELLQKFNIKIIVPGFLFIDTPGHAAFTNLRQRGGSIADLAILVIDINEGIKEQTRECIQILKENKIPFVIALNKIDKIPGWKQTNKPIFESINLQQDFCRQDFYNKASNIITAFSVIGFEADFYWQIKDFTKKLAIVPCSAKTREGIPELLAVLAGLAQKYLINKLKIGDEVKGNILEVVKEKRFVYYDCILSDGILSENDCMIIAGLEEPVVTKIRALFEALPLSKGFKKVNEIRAATGFRVCLVTQQEVFPGMPFTSLKESDITSEAIEDKKDKLMSTIKNIIKLDNKGIIVKAESLGSLEALINILRKEGISIKKAGIGNITKKDISLALVNLKENPLDAVILGFNVDVEEKDEEITIFTSDIIYQLIENFLLWREEKAREIERKKLSEIVFPCKFKIIPNYIFRRSKPAICGIKIIGGILRKDTPVMNSDGKFISKIKSIQKEGKPIEEAKAGEEIAICITDVTIGRQIKEDDILYSDISENDYKKLKENKNLLSSDELEILREIVEIKRKIKPTWGI
ncbi:MAG: translation initiation factor IF-2 [Candidatus Pacearchaeota archaeon]